MQSNTKQCAPSEASTGAVVIQVDQAKKAEHNTEQEESNSRSNKLDFVEIKLKGNLVKVIQP